MDKIKCIAVDDEPLALKVMTNHAKNVPFIDMVKTFQSPLEAMVYIQQYEIDLIFLDISMPEMSGLKLPAMLSKPPLIIFVTAYEQHAVKSYELNAIDYLLKPVSFDRFLQAVSKAIEKRKSIPPRVADREDNSVKDKTLFVRSDKRILQINITQISYIEGLKDYVIIFTEKEKIVTRESLKKIDLMLQPFGFLRIHRSYIVPIQKIKVIEGNVIRVGESKIPIGKSYKHKLITHLENKTLGDRRRD